MASDFLKIGPLITVAPIVHGSGDCAVEVRRLMLAEKFDYLAVPLPPSFRSSVLDAVSRLPRVTAVLEAVRPVFADLGCEIVEGEPDLRDADEIFRAWRAFGFVSAHRDHLRDHRDLLKDTIIWNTESGLNLSVTDLVVAEEKKTALYHRVREFMQTHEFLILPTKREPLRWRLKRWFPEFYFRKVRQLAGHALAQKP